MSSPLAQDLAQKIIEVLLSRGHVLLTKGGKPALVRELGDRMNDTLATIIGRLPPPGVVQNEVTSTFGDESLDDAVEEMVEDITASLMDSDQVEDVFSEDAQIRRDVFRVVKETLLSADRAFGETEEADVEVDLVTLGYVATKAAQRAGAPVVEAALAKAAKASHAKLLEYAPATQTARFRAALATPDARLELEEAVADELSNLVDEGKVDLPTIERKIPLGRSVASDERHATRARIDVAATKTLLRSGCTATWEYLGDDTIVVSLVPMSDQDAHAVDPYFDAFVREVQAVFGRPRPPAPEAGGGLDAWLRLAKAVEPKSGGSLKRSSDLPPPPSTPRKAEKAPAQKRTVEKAPSEKRAAPKAPAEKRMVEKAPASRREADKPPAEKRAVEKAPASRREADKAPAPKKAPAEKKATRKDAAPKSPKPASKVARSPRKKDKPAGKGRAPRSKPAPKLARSPSKRPVAKIAKKPAKPARKPVAKPARKPVRAAKKPVAKPARKPVAKPARKPAAKLSRKPVRAAKKPVARKPVRAVARKPVRAAKKPVSRKPVRAAKRPVAKPARKPAAKLSRKPVRAAKKPVSRKPVRAAKKPVSRKPVRAAKKPVAKKPLPRRALLRAAAKKTRR